MLHISDELKAKLKKAQSTDEVASLLKAAGVDEADVEKIWDEINAYREDKHLDLDELETVSGGRNWVSEGCAATVEEGSSCWGTDACDHIVVSYEYFDASIKCPNHPGPHEMQLTNRMKRIKTCKYCGYTYQEHTTCYAVFE